MKSKTNTFYKFSLIGTLCIQTPHPPPSTDKKVKDYRTTSNRPLFISIPLIIKHLYVLEAVPAYASIVAYVSPGPLPTRKLKYFRILTCFYWFKSFSFGDYGPICTIRSGKRSPILAGNGFVASFKKGLSEQRNPPQTANGMKEVTSLYVMNYADVSDNASLPEAGLPLPPRPGSCPSPSSPPCRPPSSGIVRPCRGTRRGTPCFPSELRRYRYLLASAKFPLSEVDPWVDASGTFPTSRTASGRFPNAFGESSKSTRFRGIASRLCAVSSRRVGINFQPGCRRSASPIPG